MGDALVIASPDDERWARLLAVAPGVTPFHHPAWVQLLADCYRYDALVAAVVDDTGAMTAGLPVIDIRHRIGRRRWVSLPFSDACAPLALHDEALHSLVGALDRVRADEGIAHVEVRVALPEPAHAVPTDAVIHRRRLPASVDELWASTHKSRRKGVHTARNKGVTVRRADRRQDLTEVFYGMHLATHRRHGVPVQPRRYVELLWDRIIEPGLGVVLVAEADGRPIGASVYLSWGGTLICKYGASDATAWPARANDLLMWEAFVWGVEQGDQWADFGRTEVDNVGLRAHKETWGGEEAPLVYSAIGPRPPDERGHLARAAGPILRHGPLWLTRATGELLYRYAA